MKLEPDEARLLALARAQPIADPEVRRVWEVVCEAIAQRWLTPAGRLSL